MNIHLTNLLNLHYEYSKRDLIEAINRKIITEGELIDMIEGALAGESDTINAIQDVLYLVVADDRAPIETTQVATEKPKLSKKVSV